MSIRLMKPGVPGKGQGGAKNAKAAKDKQRLSTCKACKLGVYSDEEHVWGRGLMLGICHAECVQGAAS